jgi:Tol biopolymer transport system component
MIEESTLLRALGERPASEPVYKPALDPASPGRMMRTGGEVLARRSPIGQLVLLSVMVTIGLVLILLGGAVVSGGPKVVELPLSPTEPVANRGLVAYTSAAYSWDNALRSHNLGLYSIASSGGEGRLLVPLPGKTTVATEGWEVHEAVQIWPAGRWSPDKSRIAFRGTDVRPGIIVVDADGSDLRWVADATPDGNADVDPILGFAWSPDGTRIAYITPEAPGWSPNNENNGKLYVADLATDTVHELSGEANGSVGWSPDGTTIAFGRTRPGTSLLVLINADGTGERSFRYDHPGLQNTLGGIAWSPDSSKIAFVQTRFGLIGPDEGNFLMVVNRDGAEPRELAHWPMEGCCAFGSVGGLSGGRLTEAGSPRSSGVTSS